MAVDVDGAVAVVDDELVVGSRKASDRRNKLLVTATNKNKAKYPEPRDRHHHCNGILKVIIRRA